MVFLSQFISVEFVFMFKLLLNKGIGRGGLILIDILFGICVFMFILNRFCFIIWKMCYFSLPSITLHRYFKEY